MRYVEQFIDLYNKGLNIQRYQNDKLVPIVVKHQYLMQRLSIKEEETHTYGILGIK